MWIPFIFFINHFCSFTFESLINKHLSIKTETKVWLKNKENLLISDLCLLLLLQLVLFYYFYQIAMAPNATFSTNYRMKLHFAVKADDNTFTYFERWQLPGISINVGKTGINERCYIWSWQLELIYVYFGEEISFSYTRTWKCWQQILFIIILKLSCLFRST